MRSSTGHRRPVSTLLDLFRSRRRRPQRKSPLSRWRPRLEPLETRLAPATLVDLTSQGTTTVGDAIFSTDVKTVGAGTGQIDPFDRISTNKATEQGYNTDYPHVVLDNANKGGTNFVHSLRITDLPIEIRNGVAYYRFELDINQSNLASSKDLSLDALQLWQANVGNLGDYAPGTTPDKGTGGFPAADNATLRYNLDSSSAGDVFIGLNGNLQSGSGNTIDMSALIPVSDFDPTQTFVYLYSAFGFQTGKSSDGSTWTNNGGFEEWDRQTAQVIDGHKFNDLNINHAWDQATEPALNGWTVYIDVNNNNTLDPGEPFTTTGTTDLNGDGQITGTEIGYYRFFVAPGTYTIREVLQTGWVQTAPDNTEGEYSVTLASGGSAHNLDFGNVQIVTPTLVTTASPNITLGTTAPTITDTAVLSGGFNPTGSITFTLTFNGNPVPGATQTDTVNGNGSYSASFTLPTTGTVAGTYIWSASYTGDAHNNPASETGTLTNGEATVVSPANPTLLTTPNAASVALGGTATDTADLEGGYFPTGSIVFTLTNTDTSTVVFTSTPVTVSGNGTYTSPGYTVTLAGNYQWAATYNGDGNNNTAIDTNVDQEKFTVPKNPTGIVTTASDNITLTDEAAPTITDTAVLSGGFNPTGSITFTLTFTPTGSNTASTPPGFQPIVDTVNGNGSYSASYTLPTTGTVAGTYIWSAIYTGDQNNQSSSETGTLTNGEATVVSPANPTLVTTAGPTVTLGDGNPLTDTADLEGGYFPVGSITFTLYSPSNVAIYTDTVSVSGNGNYTTDNLGTPSGGNIPAVAGQYHWTATYTDSLNPVNNNTATDPGTSAQEGEAVIAPSLAITKTPDSTVPLNSTDAVGFSITVSNSGAGAAFNVNLSDPLPAPAGVTWTSATLVSETSGINAANPPTLSGNNLSDAIGTIPSGGTVVFHVSGTTASGFAGTLNNTATATSSNNPTVMASASETVLAPSLSVVKTPDSASPLNSTDAVGFTITVSNAAGAGTAYNVNLSDPLPAPTGVSWTSATLVSESSGVNAQNPPTLSGNTLSDAIGNMAAGTTVVFHVSGTTASGFAGTLNNTATATPANGSPASGSASETVLAPSLTISKTVTSGGTSATIHPGDTASFTITVSNASGAGTAYGVVLTDQLPDASQLTWTVTANNGFDDTPSVDASGNLVSGNLTGARRASLPGGTTISITVSAAIPATIFGPTGSQLGNGDPLPSDLFELDGNALDDPAVAGQDWDSALGLNATIKSTSSQTRFLNDVFNSGTDDIFKTGKSKDIQGIQGNGGPWVFTAAKPQAKDDIENAFTALYEAPPLAGQTVGDEILFAGLTRYDNSGDSTAGFWFFKNAVATGTNGNFTGSHSDGDLLLVMDFSKGGSSPAVSVFEWVGTDATGHLEALTTKPNTTDAIVNGSTITLPWTFTDKSGTPGNQALPGEFLEVGVNLTALGLSPCFSTFMAETRSSTTEDSTLSDFVLGNFNTCMLTLPNTAHLHAANTAVSDVDSNQATITVVEDGMPMLAASTGSASGTAGLTDQQLQGVMAQAIAQWRAAGVDPQRLAALDQQVVQVADLNHGELGWTLGNHTWIDRTAEGWGWSVDGSPAQGKMDLLTVVTHELGHVLGMPQTPTGVMELTLAPGVRLFPGSGPMGEAPASTSGLVATTSAVVSSPLAEAPAATPGGAAPPAATAGLAVTVSDQASALAPHSPSVITVTSPSTAGADITAALAARSEGTSSATAPGSADRTQATVLGSSQGSVQLAGLGTGSSTLAPYALRPLSTETATTAAVDLLLSAGSATLPDEEGTLPGATPDRPAGPEDAPLFDGAFDGLFGEDSAPLSDGAVTRLFGGEDGASWAADGAVGAAAAILGAGYVLRPRLDDREERRARVATERT
jgi:fimbrial isopeptide formation D2 family protein/uncharacterized repeat protein (TIGR01451 family)